MVLGDYNFFLFNYKFIGNFYDFFLNRLEIDILDIKYYYYNLLSWNKWKNEKFLLFIIILFYITLIIKNKFHLFILLKIIFYITKYILKYIFILIDFFLFILWSKLNIIVKNFDIKYRDFYLIIFKIIYNIIFKLFYFFYFLIFNILPSIIHRRFFFIYFEEIKRYCILLIHLFLDFLEWLPSSPLRDLPNVSKKFLKWSKRLILPIYISKYNFFIALILKLYQKYLCYRIFLIFYTRFLLLYTKYKIYIFRITFFNQIYIINLLGIFNIISYLFTFFLIKAYFYYMYIIYLLIKLQEYYYFFFKKYLKNLYKNVYKFFKYFLIVVILLIFFIIGTLTVFYTIDTIYDTQYLWPLYLLYDIFKWYWDHLDDRDIWKK